MTLILSNEDIEQVFDVGDCIDALEDAYREMAHGRVINLKRVDIESPLEKPQFTDGRYELKTMAAIIPKRGISALRFISAAHSFERVSGTLKNRSHALAPGGRFVGLVIPPRRCGLARSPAPIPAHETCVIPNFD